MSGRVWRAEPAGRGCPAFAIFSSELVSNCPTFGLDYFYSASRSEGIQAFTTQNAWKIEIGCLDEFRAFWCIILCALPSIITGRLFDLAQRRRSLGLLYTSRKFP